MLTLRTASRVLRALKTTQICEQPFHRWLAPTLRELKRRKNNLDPEKPVHRKTFLEWNYDTEIYAFSKRLGEEFNNDLLQQALTERSYIIREEERQKNVGIEQPTLNLFDNKELVSKGSDFIDDVIKRYLRTVLPRLPEEGIIGIHKYLTSIETLSHVSFHIGTSELILCAEFPVEKLTLSNVLKAITAALVESSGDSRAALFVRDFIITQIADKDLHQFWEPEEPIKLLSEILARDDIQSPEPRLIGCSGKNTILACFRVGLYTPHNKQMIGLGFGETVDIAHEMAARDSLRQLFGTSDNILLPFNLKLDQLCASTVKNVSVNEWSQKILPTRPVHYEFRKAKELSSN
ncbi:39S ribosomal protein L44, mitochondrial [Melanaphis sacchari]|uniref:Large ribosomal subunit protein mL44 n=1 Tax=Melanaphis sacchari TaxID=742174 RepID=A0A2H8TQA4_9HEMI|nr:39S ribosomal protein L44, mitochondrial [Melanaphis sacchari]